MKTIILSMLLVSCAVDPSPVSESNQYGTPTDNTNVACVVDGYAWKCGVNTWTWGEDNNARSCSNFGTCKNGEACRLWDDEIGVCQSQ